MNPKRCALVVAGGSGGHIFPAIAFAEALKKADPDTGVIFVTGHIGGGRDHFAGMGERGVLRLSSAPFRGTRSLVDPRFYSALCAGVVQACAAIDRLKPSLVAGFGGYHTVPVVLAARLKGVPSILHEQNADLGLANRFLSPLASRVVFAFPAEGRKNALHAGMPLRQELRRIERSRATAELGLNPARRTLVVTGGSQGARALNDAAADFVLRHGDNFAERWQVLHLTGKADFERLDARYTHAHIAVRRMEFLQDMSLAYSAADLIVSRAGAVTLHELAFFGKCAILVPYPGARAHQAANARALTDRGAAVFVEQAHFDAEFLKDKLEWAEREPDAVTAMGRRSAETLRTDGARVMAEESLKLMKVSRTGAPAR